MDARRNGKRSARITSALLSLGGLLVAGITGFGLWSGHDEATKTESTSSSTSSSSGSSSDTSGSSSTRSDDTPASTDQGVTQGSSGSVSSDATTTGS